MCGRFFIAQAPDIFRAFFGYPEQPNFPARYNVAPTQPVAVVLAEGGDRHFRLVRWGFWPGWLKDPKGFPLIINAQVEPCRRRRPSGAPCGIAAASSSPTASTSGAARAAVAVP